MRKRSFRGVVDVVFGGKKPVEEKRVDAEKKGKGKNNAMQNLKRKVEDADLEREKETDKPLSKREMKRRAHKARMEAAGGQEDKDGKAVGDPSAAEENVDVPMVEGKDEVTMTEGNFPGIEVNEDPMAVVLGLAVIIAGEDALEDIATALSTTLVDAIVWNVEGWLCDGAVG
ncbi:MAG: hypothetical protein Q9218_002476 [Villophora microphyllina]